MHIIIMVIVILNNIIEFSDSQDCIAYGKRCSDHGQCCGGCCVEGLCTDTYRSCHELGNPCYEHYCPAGLDCIVFQPTDCPECEVQAICQ